jgi:hypothetical protein
VLGALHPPWRIDGIASIGVDEIHWGLGMKADNFLTVIYQIDVGCRRLLWDRQSALGEDTPAGYVWRLRRQLSLAQPWALLLLELYVA